MVTRRANILWLMMPALLLACGGDDAPDRVLTAVDSGEVTADAGADFEVGGDADDPRPQPDAGAAPDGSHSEQTDGGTRFCAPNRDGVITREEVPLRAGLNARFRVATDVSFDTQGAREDDRTVWDFTEELPGDHLTISELRPIDDLWFAAEFPDATYASRLSDSEDLLGVFQVTDDALLLLGVVSPEDGFARTELTYDPPVPVLAFPITRESRWQVDSDVSGLAQGYGAAYDERYDVRIDAEGLVRTPFGEFDAYRVRVELDRFVVGFGRTTVRTYLFVTECFGTVASITSQDNEDEVEFSQAAEVRRLSP